MLRSSHPLCILPTFGEGGELAWKRHSDSGTQSGHQPFSVHEALHYLAPTHCDSCANLDFFSQALETLDNGKPYIISYLVDLDMVLKCLR